jgi:membrane-bound serine protease (ClpP class)
MNRTLGALSFLLLLGWAALRAQAPDASPAEPAAAPASAPAAAPAPEAPRPAGAKTALYVIPIHDEIAKPTLYIVRKGVKEAIAAGATTVVLDMNTPGGGLAETLEIMEILDRFRESGNCRVITFVNREAGSAGAIIAAITDEIYFAPKSVIGAAEVVLATGEDVGSSMKRKITSFLSAKVRTLTEKNPRRGRVLQAMMDPAYELRIGDTVVKAKDVLLTLTSTEAMAAYGDPPEPLFGAGIVDDLPALCRTLTGGAEYAVQSFEVTWSVKLAQWLTMLSPLFLGLGGLLLYIEFKTPGFGVFGISGILLILIVFFGHYVAGLSGHEPMLVFLLGAILVLVEVFFLPGTLVLALPGIVLMLGSLLWGMADIWPGQGIAVDPAVFYRPLINLLVSFVLTVAMGAAMVRFLPRSWIYDRIILRSEITGVSGSPVSSLGTAEGGNGHSLAGATGRAVTGLFPSGEIEVAGQRVQARLEVGSAPVGATIRVVRRADFVYIVEVLE